MGEKNVAAPAAEPVGSGCIDARLNPLSILPVRSMLGSGVRQAFFFRTQAGALVPSRIAALTRELAGAGWVFTVGQGQINAARGPHGAIAWQRKNKDGGCELGIQDLAVHCCALLFRLQRKGVGGGCWAGWVERAWILFFGGQTASQGRQEARPGPPCSVRTRTRTAQPRTSRPRRLCHGVGR
ncbi:hypothetical protein BS50DRAFT_191480 [Corynespora cassiicola Philippines]|uniref:Uncharacterized protein n=1 Tax=Corynespora cassiicola Philippines TaxID=1448308 RepID=A0A2T2P7G0_CORCC|nr:hypothetical protein BS50DRAFT_191480 [Corynespora cassiicola Philippines]